MKCLNTECKGTLHITHTHSNDHSRAARAICQVCQAGHTIVSQVLPGAAQGKGYRTVGQKLARGRAEISYDEVTSEEEDGEAGIEPAD